MLEVADTTEATVAMDKVAGCVVEFLDEGY